MSIKRDKGTQSSYRANTLHQQAFKIWNYQNHTSNYNQIYNLLWLKRNLMENIFTNAIQLNIW